jgi:uncharacterized membrane protein YozB (DUF420 family)
MAGVPPKPKKQKKSYAAKKREERQAKWRSITTQIWLYLFCASGGAFRILFSFQNGSLVLATHDLLAAIGGALLAVAVRAWAELDGDPVAKKKVLRRRLKEAITLGLSSQIIAEELFGAILG